MKKQLLRLGTLCLLALCCCLGLQAQTYTNQDFSATWSMNKGSLSTGIADPAAAIGDMSWGMGSNIVLNTTETGTHFEKVFTLFTDKTKKDNKRESIDDNYVEFKFTPKAGVTATPTSLSFDIVKVATGDPKIWVECIQGTTTTSIAEEVAITRDNGETPSEHQTFDLTTKTAIVATTGETIFRIYIGKLTPTSKQVGIANVVVNGKVNGEVTKYTTVYDLATAINDNTKKIEKKEGDVAATTADPAAKAPLLHVDATNGKLGPNSTDWAQINANTILTLPGVPQGSTITFALYNSTALTINGIDYKNGETYTTKKDENVVMTCKANGYIKSITVVGTEFVTLAGADGYTHIWPLSVSSGGEKFNLQGKGDYEYTIDDRTLIINTAKGKFVYNKDEWTQCGDGTIFKVPAYAGSKISWGAYNTGVTAGMTVGGDLVNKYYVVLEEGTAELTAKGLGYMSSMKIEPIDIFEATGNVTGASIDGAAVTFTAEGNGQKYSSKIASGAISVKLPADTYTLSLSEDVNYVISSPENVVVSDNGSIGTITVIAAQEQTVTGQITNAPAEAFELTFTGASHNKKISLEANATSYSVVLDPDTYTINSSAGTLSPLSKASFKVLKEAVTFNIYYPEAAVPAATSQNITVDNTATVAANIYNTVTDALAAAKAGNISNPIITLTSGQTYMEQVKVDMPNVTLKTSGEETATITFYYGIGYTYYSLGSDGYYNKDRANTRNSINMIDPQRWGATVLVTSKGNNFRAENITFENSFNQRYTKEEVVDGVRPNGAQKINYDRTLTEGATGYKAADTKDVTERGAAIAFENDPTGVQLYNCTFIGSQDTFFSSGKIYVKDCNIIGNTDYIFGGGYVVFDNCDLTIGGYSDKETSAYITAYKEGNTLDASKTYIFRDCTVKAGTRKYILANLGRDWGGAGASVYYFNLKNEIGDKLKFEWKDMGGGVSAATANLHIYDFDPTINAKYNTTGSTGANINGVVPDEKALELYEGVVSKLGFTPEKMYSDVLNLDENSAYNVCNIAASNGVTRDITLKLALTANNWSPIVLPFALTAEQIATMFGSDAKVAELKTADNAQINFTTATAIEANKPYIINVAENFASANISGIKLVKADAQQTVAGWTFCGIYEAGKVPVDSYYFNNSQLKKAADGTTDIKPFCAYLSNATAETVTYTIDGVLTAINKVKVGVDAEGNGPIYNLAGQKVDSSYKGIVIKNGKKVIVK